MAVSNRLGRVPALDGLRGVAILLVIGRHYFKTPSGGGSTGVGLFFVLSGFLITTLLLEEHAETGRIRLRAFYARRARRLVPALVLMLAGYLIGAALQGRTHDAVRAAAAGAFYTANVAQAYWPHLIGREPIGPLWSLAEEEQFDLLWPALLILALTLALRRRWVKIGLLAAIFLICAERVYLVVEHAFSQRVYSSPEAAADGLLAGVLLAFMLWKRRPALTGEVVAAALTPLVLVTIFPFSAAFSGPVIDIAGAVVVALAVQPGSFASRALSWRPLVWVGLISYSLYLWHMVVLSWFGYADRGLALAIAVLVAWLSYRYVEVPFRRRRRVDPIPAPVVAAELA